MVGEVGLEGGSEGDWYTRTGACSKVQRREGYRRNNKVRELTSVQGVKAGLEV